MALPAVTTQPGLDGPTPPSAAATWQRPVRRGPALFVVGLAAFVALAGGLAGALAGGPGRSAGGPVVARADGIAAVAAAPILRPIRSPDEPPANVLAALVVPAGATVTGTTRQDGGVGLYDRTITFAVKQDARALVDFYRTELRAAHWSLVGVTAATDGSTLILATHAGADGYEWEAGVRVTPRNPLVSPALAGDGTGPTSSLSLRLLAVDDLG